MRPTTQVNEGTTPVNRGGGSVDLVFDDPQFELVVLEHLHQIFLKWGAFSIAGLLVN